MEHNKETEAASNARKKRKMVIQAKGRMSYRRTPPQITTPQTTFLQITPSSITADTIPSSSSQHNQLPNTRSEYFHKPSLTPNQTIPTYSNLRTPLSNITSTTFHERNQCNGLSNLNKCNRSNFNFEPNSNTIQSRSKRKVVQLANVGVNLMNRFENVNSTLPTPIYTPVTTDVSTNDSTTDEEGNLHQTLMIMVNVSYKIFDL